MTTAELKCESTSGLSLDFLARHSEWRIATKNPVLCFLSACHPGLVPGSPSLRVILNAKREGSSDRTYCLCHPGHCSGITFLSLHFVHDSATQPCQSASCLMRHSSCLSFPAPTGNLPIFGKTLAFLQEFFICVSFIIFCNMNKFVLYTFFVVRRLCEFYFVYV